MLGVQVRIRPESVGLLIIHLLNRKFELALSISSAAFPDPHGTLFALLSAGGFWNDTHYDSLVYKADAMVGDDTSRHAICRQAVDQAPWIPLGVDNTAVLSSPRAHGLNADPGRDRCQRLVAGLRPVIRPPASQTGGCPIQGIRRAGGRIGGALSKCAKRSYSKWPGDICSARNGRPLRSSIHHLPATFGYGNQ